MICLSLSESAGQFWWPAEFENVANPDFENLKHLQNPGHLPLTTDSTLWMWIGALPAEQPVIHGGEPI